jgi:hypothetical protein
MPSEARSELFSLLVGERLEKLITELPLNGLTVFRIASPAGVREMRFTRRLTDV